MARRRFQKRFNRVNSTKTTRWVGANAEDNVVSSAGNALQAATIYTMVSNQDYAQGASGEIEAAGATLLRSIIHLSMDVTVVAADDVALWRDTLVVSMALVVANSNDTVETPNASASLGLEDYLWTCQRCFRLAGNAAGTLNNNAFSERPYQLSETFDIRVKRKLDRDFVGLLIDIESMGNPDPTTVYSWDMFATTRCLLGGRF